MNRDICDKWIRESENVCVCRAVGERIDARSTIKISNELVAAREEEKT